MFTQLKRSLCIITLVTTTSLSLHAQMSSYPILEKADFVCDNGGANQNTLDSLKNQTDSLLNQSIYKINRYKSGICSVASEIKRIQDYPVSVFAAGISTIFEFTVFSIVDAYAQNFLIVNKEEIKNQCRFNTAYGMEHISNLIDRSHLPTNHKCDLAMDRLEDYFLDIVINKAQVYFCNQKVKDPNFCN